MKGTFRDPQGRLFREGDQIFREVFPEHSAPVLEWIKSPLAQRWMEDGRLVKTRVLSAEPAQPVLFEHERIFFPTYPWEWTPGQWKQAAALTLDLCEEAVDYGYVIKDATPLNILFSGSRAVFVDVLSFEKRDPHSALWLAYAQFVRTFLLPLAAYAHLGWPLFATQQRRDGYEPGMLAPYLSGVQKWRSPFRSLVTLPLCLEKTRAGKNSRSYKKSTDSALATHVLKQRLSHIRRTLRDLGAHPHTSRWSGYMSSAHHYAPEDHAAKQDFVRRALEKIHPSYVLDVGANTGVYSRIAVQSGAQVVGWDTDVQAADLNWEKASHDGLSILPMIADFARPTPAVGWRNEESSDLINRSRGRFDCVLMLGVLHHLLIADQIPLPEILDQLATISNRFAILEWIPKPDSQFSELCRGREEIYSYLEESYFETELRKRFAVCMREKLPNGRTLCLAEKAK